MQVRKSVEIAEEEPTSYRFFNRGAKSAAKIDAATLIDISSSLATIEKETLYLSREISLQSTASELAGEIFSEFGKKASKEGGEVEQAARGLSKAIGELGRAAQESLVNGGAEAAGWKARPKKWDLAVASARAQKAVEKLTSAYAHTAGDAVVASGVSKKMDEAWRRDALRALNALSNAPEALQAEVRRLRFAKLTRELRVLGLQTARVESLTLDDLRKARARRAKALHPDVAKPGLLGRLFRFGRGSDAARAAKDDQAMVELNKAYDTVRWAVTAPMFL